MNTTIQAEILKRIQAQTPFVAQPEVSPGLFLNHFALRIFEYFKLQAQDLQAIIGNFPRDS